MGEDFFGSSCLYAGRSPSPEAGERGGGLPLCFVPNPGPLQEDHLGSLMYLAEFGGQRDSRLTYS